MSDTPDRPYALLFDAELDVHLNAARWLAVSDPTRKNRRAYADLLDERNYRVSLSEGLPF